MKSEAVSAFSVGLWHAVEVATARETPGTPRTRPRASVIIVNYNGRQDLERCLRSLAREAGLYEVIVVDNASTDGSPDFVEQAFPSVRLIRNPDNGGFGQGNNLAAQVAAGRYLAFLNPDTEVEPGWLDALIDALEADCSAGMATSQVRLLHTPARINTCGNDVHCTGLALCRGLGDEAAAYSETSEVGAVSGAAFAMRRDLFRMLGGFDEDFFMYVEDTDLSWRARLAGFRVVYVPESVVYHDYKLRFGPNKTYYQERNRYLMLLKTLRWPTLLLLLPALLLAEVITWSFVLLKDRPRLSNKFRGYWWIVRNWRQIMRSRQQTQLLRRASDRQLLARSVHRLAFKQTGEGMSSRLASLVFDPMFLVLRGVLLSLVRW